MATETAGPVTSPAVRRWFTDPIDAGSLHALRIGFGALMVAAVLRFWALGWIETIYIEPRFHFTWLGFSWVQPLAAPWIYLQFGAMIWSAGALAVGWRPRLHAAVFFMLFTWAELSEKAAYLNHYYLVSLLALLMAVTPWTHQGRLASHLPAWCLTLFRGQVAAVYVFAGLAKIGSDWLVAAEPLRTWLQAYAHVPLIGPWLAWPPTAHAMSVAGLVFDTSIVALLLYPRTRRAAYAVAAFFHIAVWLLFPIGVFSFVMLLAATVFFAPDWPARFVRRRAQADHASSVPVPRVRRATIAAVCLYLALQWTLPLRHLAYPGHTNWTEQGFRFAWRVMLIEKAGSLAYRIQCATHERATLHAPSAHLTYQQHRMIGTQPDMILEYAHHLAATARSEQCPNPAVFADSVVSLNGRRAQRMIDPAVDLAAAPRSLMPATWILPLSPRGSPRLTTTHAPSP